MLKVGVPALVLPRFTLRDLHDSIRVADQRHMQAQSLLLFVQLDVIAMFPKPGVVIITCDTNCEKV